jgi:hypothetical protein
MGKGTFSIIVNQTESKAKTPTTDSQFLIPGFPASKLRAEKMVLSSYGLKLSNGKGEVIKYTYPCALCHPEDRSQALGYKQARNEEKNESERARKKDFESLKPGLKLRVQSGILL